MCAAAPATSFIGSRNRCDGPADAAILTVHWRDQPASLVRSTNESGSSSAAASRWPASIASRTAATRSSSSPAAVRISGGAVERHGTRSDRAPCVAVPGRTPGRRDHADRAPCARSRCAVTVNVASGSADKITQSACSAASRCTRGPRPAIFLVTTVLQSRGKQDVTKYRASGRALETRQRGLLRQAGGNVRIVGAPPSEANASVNLPAAAMAPNETDTAPSAAAPRRKSPRREREDRCIGTRTPRSSVCFPLRRKDPTSRVNKKHSGNGAEV